MTLTNKLLDKLDETRVDKEKIAKAIKFAEYYHKGQKRLTGEDFVCHPLRVATEILQYTDNQYTDVLVGALLHDCVEDTRATIAEVWNLFGKEVAQIVEGLTRKKKINC